MAIKDNETAYPWIPVKGGSVYDVYITNEDNQLLPNGDILSSANIATDGGLTITPGFFYCGNVYDDTLRYGVIRKTLNLAKRNTSGAIVQEKELALSPDVRFSLGYYLLPGVADDAFSYED